MGGFVGLFLITVSSSITALSFVQEEAAVNPNFPATVFRFDPYGNQAAPGFPSLVQLSSFDFQTHFP
jgi:hypothetical protein